MYCLVDVESNACIIDDSVDVNMCVEKLLFVDGACGLDGHQHHHVSFD